MKTLYLHIGIPKTGTTSIQSFCYENREIFEKYGYCYPVMPFKYANGRHLARNGLFLDGLVRDKEGKRDREEENRRMETGFSVIRECFDSFDNVVVSNETLWVNGTGRSKGIWKKLQEEAEKGNYQIRIVVYFRNQAEFLESWWNQGIKSSLVSYASSTYEEYLGSVNMEIADYYGTLNKIAAYFGKEHVTVRRFDRSEFAEGKIQLDFLQAVGFVHSDEMVLQDEKDHLNERLAGNMPEFKRVINGLSDFTWPDNQFFRKSLAKNSALSEEAYPCRFYSAEEAGSLMGRFEEGNRKLAEEYIGDGRPLFLTETRELQKWSADNPFLREDMVRVSAMLDLDLKQRIADAREERKDLSVEERMASLTERMARMERELKKARGGK